MYNKWTTISTIISTMISNDGACPVRRKCHEPTVKLSSFPFPLLLLVLLLLHSRSFPMNDTTLSQTERRVEERRGRSDTQGAWPTAETAAIRIILPLNNTTFYFYYFIQLMIPHWKYPFNVSLSLSLPFTLTLFQSPRVVSLSPNSPLPLVFLIFFISSSSLLLFSFFYSSFFFFLVK